MEVLSSDKGEKTINFFAPNTSNKMKAFIFGWIDKETTGNPLSIIVKTKKVKIISFSIIYFSEKW